jgi:hypothetical protein
MKHYRIIHLIWIMLAICTFSVASASAQDKYTADDAPGELSLGHSESPSLKNCLSCHNEEFEVDPGRCLKCHTEIAQRISSSRGYHRDKAEECAACHGEHQGKDSRLIELDTANFDHEETGFSRIGAHNKIKDCRFCHRKDNTVPRRKTQSYLIRDPGCLSCHLSPHPGRQEVCISCHTQENWRVDIWDQRGLR